MTLAEKVAYLGPPGTYSHQAALQLFENEIKQAEPSVDLTSCFTIPDCFDQLEQGNVQWAVVPIENSTNGSVVYTLDCLKQLFHEHNDRSIKVVKDTYIQVQHNLMSLATDLSHVKRVYSHPQVWGQCDVWYDAHLKGIERIDTSSTAKAASLAAKDPESAAIAGKAAAHIYNLPILGENISNTNDNTTRFLLLCRKPKDKQDISGPEQGKNYKTAVSFVVEHTIPGALCKALEVFAKQGLNLTSICQRPSGKSKWTYVFFVEVDGHVSQPEVARAIEEIHEYCLEVRNLGSFELEVPC